MKEIKVGDKVRITVDSWSSMPRGTIGRVTRVDFRPRAPFLIQKEGFLPLSFSRDQFELVEEAPSPSAPRRLQVGDKVRVKSREWYERNKNRHGTISSIRFGFNSTMAEYCGKVLTISEVLDVGNYRCEGNSWSWGDDMFDLDEPTETAPLRFGFHMSKSAKEILGIGSKPTTIEKLPLINNTKLLTNIKVD